MTPYHLHFISFSCPDKKSFNIAFGSGANVQPWHLDALEVWLQRMRTNPPTAEEIENYHKTEVKYEVRPEPKIKKQSPKKSVDFDILDLFS